MDFLRVTKSSGWDHFDPKSLIQKDLSKKFDPKSLIQKVSSKKSFPQISDEKK